MLSKREAFTKPRRMAGSSQGREAFTKPRRQGRLFVISAASGTGKTTLARQLLKADKNLVASISYTTRQKRTGERHGKDYFFVSEDQFFKIREQGGFLEWAKVFGHYYGTPKKEVEAQLRRGLDVLLVIDVQGAKQIKRIDANAVFIFLVPPSKEELRRRLEKRGTESRKEIDRRFRVASKELLELNNMTLRDYRIVNRYIPVAYEVLKGIIRAERMATGATG